MKHRVPLPGMDDNFSYILWSNVVIVVAVNCDL